MTPIPIVVTQTPVAVTQTNQPQQPPQKVVVLTAPVSSNGDVTNQQQTTPTAYIAPSLNRVTKVNPQQQQQQQQQPPTNASVQSLRRTAAVQPTPHDSGSTQTTVITNRQQVVTPISINAQQQQHQAQQEPNQWNSMQSTNVQVTVIETTTASGVQQETIQASAAESSVQVVSSQLTFSQESTASTSQASNSNPGPSITNIINKRTREDYQ